MERATQDVARDADSLARFGLNEAIWAARKSGFRHLQDEIVSYAGLQLTRAIPKATGHPNPHAYLRSTINHCVSDVIDREMRARRRKRIPTQHDCRWIATDQPSPLAWAIFNEESAGKELPPIPPGHYFQPEEIDLMGRIIRENRAESNDKLAERIFYATGRTPSRTSLHKLRKAALVSLPRSRITPEIDGQLRRLVQANPGISSRDAAARLSKMVGTKIGSSTVLFRFKKMGLDAERDRPRIPPPLWAAVHRVLEDNPTISNSLAASQVAAETGHPLSHTTISRMRKKMGLSRGSGSHLPTAARNALARIIAADCSAPVYTIIRMVQAETGLKISTSTVNRFKRRLRLAAAQEKEECVA